MHVQLSNYLRKSTMEIEDEKLDYEDVFQEVDDEEDILCVV